jgi:hypothetical protein
MAIALPKTFLEAMMTTLAKQEEVVKALPSIFKAVDARTWVNPVGHSKTDLPDMLTIDELRAAFPAVFAQLCTTIQETVPTAIAEVQGSSSSSVIIDLAAFAATLEDLFIGTRRMGKFWARWLVFHFLMGITPGFKWTDLDSVDVKGADVITSYSLPALSKEFSMMGMIRQALCSWLTDTFTPEFCKELNADVYLTGTALTAMDAKKRPVEFYDRTLVLVLTTGTATAERHKIEAAKKASRKARAKQVHREAAKQAGRDTAICKSGPQGKAKQVGEYTLAVAAGIAVGGARAGAGGGR